MRASLHPLMIVWLGLMMGRAHGADETGGNAPKVMGAPGAEWFEELSRANADYRKSLEAWRTWMSQEGGADSSQMSARLNLKAQIAGLQQRRDMLTGLREDKLEEQARLSEASTVRQGFEADYGRRIGDARHAVESAYTDLVTAMASSRQARAAQRALQAWWNAYQSLDWDAHFAGQPDPRAPLRQQLEVLAAQLGEPIEGGVTTLMRLARTEEEERVAARSALLRQPDEGLEQVQETLASLDADIRSATAQIEQCQGQVQEIENTATHSREADALLANIRQVAASFGRLETSLATDPGMEAVAVNRESWCALYVHEGILGYLDEQPRGIDRLKTAASSYGGPCHEVAYEELDIPTLQMAWADALFLDSQEHPAWLLFDGEPGAWAIDGTTVDVSGTTRERVAAGTHRIVHVGPGGPGDVSTAIEDFKPDDHIGVRLVDGKIVLDVIAPEAKEWIVPVRHEVFPVQGEPMKPAPTPWSAGVGFMVLRFGGAVHVGGSAGMGRSLLRRSRLELGAGLDLDWLAAEAPYAYGAGVTPALVRVRAVLDLRAPEGRLRPVARLSPGFLPPMQAVTLDLSGGTEIRVADRLGVDITLGASSSFWKGSALWLEPFGELDFSTSF